MNQATHPFTFPIPLCDGEVHGIDTEEKYFIDVYTESGYWQVVAEEEAHERLELFTPDGNRRWKLMPMGALNAAPTF